MSAADIICEAGKAYGLTYTGMIGRTRKRPFIIARAAATLALRDRGMSYPQIAKRIGGRDHSTIIHYVKAWSHMLDDPDFAALVERLKAMPVAVMPAPIAFVWTPPSAPPRLKPIDRRTLRQRHLAGEIDFEEITEAEFNAMLVRGSRALNASIAAQFAYTAPQARAT